MDGFHDTSELLGIGLREHAVPEIEDVARPSTGAPQDVVDALLQSIPGREQQHRIEVALTSGARTLEAIGEATRAGVTCGSCRPAISRMIAEASFSTEGDAEDVPPSPVQAGVQAEVFVAATCCSANAFD